jgi:WhiB family redox-sensing transcriptional regulator
MTAPLTIIPGPWADQSLRHQADPAWCRRRGWTAAMARRICAPCPVRIDCLDYALAGADTWGGIATGIWGGTSPRERALLRRARKAQAA